MFSLSFTQRCGYLLKGIRALFSQFLFSRSTPSNAIGPALTLAVLASTASLGCPQFDEKSDDSQPANRPQGNRLLAGAYAKNIDPESFPVWVSGGIVAGKSERIVDSLFARSLVIEQELPGTDHEAIAVCVVDSLGVPGWIVEKAQAIVAKEIPLEPHQVLISATHSHSAPALMGAHGTPAQDDYAEKMPVWIAESIIEAYRKRTPAKIGSGVSNADRFIHCRRWFMEPGHAGGVLFSGRETNLVAMNPGHDSPYKIRQTAEVDRTIPILSVQTQDGKPLAVLASFSTHYAGAPALSSDYFGVVAKELAQQLRPDNPNAFVGIMANATSGDANCIDFARPAKAFDYREVGSYVAARILNALPSIEHEDHSVLGGRLEFLSAKVRLADPAELAQATSYVESKLADRLPSNIEENYARETVLLAKMPPTRQVPLQALRVGDMAIVGYPTETYNATGLAVRAASPFRVTLNIGLANDLLGYLPPADQFLLGGYTTWRARTSCLEEATEARVVESLSSLVHQLIAPKQSSPGDQPLRIEDSVHPDLPTSKPVVLHQMPDSAVSPENSLSHFELLAHQRIELAAFEPNVIDPVAIRFDDAGKLWVVEMSDYPTNQTNEGLGRIRVLTDENLDGRYDRAKVFAQGLLFPTGLQLHRDGALVSVGGKLLFLRDTDRDGTADRTEEWLEGFAVENPQLRFNDPDFGIDGALYLANGLRSSKISHRGGSTPPETAESPGTLSISNSDLRWDWIGQSGRAIGGPSQFGMSWDRFGNRYFCSNRNPCDAVVIEPRQAAMSPLVGLAPMTTPVLPPGEKSTVRPLVSAWTTSNLHAGQFTAACGVLISHSTHLPGASLGNALTCEPTGSLVHRVGIGRVSGRTVPEEPQRDSEWLASRDPWFRPVNLEEGPDAGIYIVDMHRAVIEHPDWVPEELKKRTDERWGEHCGRIYRVVRSNAPAVDPIFLDLHQRPLSTRDTSELCSLLDHPRAWMHQTAARLLFERVAQGNSAEKTTIHNALLEHVQRVALQPSNPTGILRAFYLLNASEIAGPQSSTSPDPVCKGWRALLETCLIDPKNPSHREPALRAALWRLASQTNTQSEAILRTTPLVLRDAHQEEATHCAWYLADLFAKYPTIPTGDLAYRKELLEAAVARSIDLADDPNWLMAISSVYRSEPELFALPWIEQAAKALDEKKMIRTFSTTAFETLVAKVAAPEDARWITARDTWTALALQRLESGPPQDETQRRVIFEPQIILQLAVARGIAKSTDSRWLATQSPLWTAWANSLSNPQFSPKIHSGIAELLAKPIAPEQSRLCKTALRTALERCEDPDLRREYLAAWSKHTDEPELDEKSSIDWVLENFDGETPAMRSVMFQAIRSRPDRLAKWLDAIDRQQISSTGLDASQIQSLMQVTGDLQPRIAKWLSGRVQADRQKVIDRYTDCLSLEVNLERGKQHFIQHCSACHRIDGLGVGIGPDISDSRTQTPTQLLVAILDPNRAIDNNYYRVRVQLNEGTIHDGIVVEESSEHLILKNQNSDRLVLNKTQIEAIKSSGVSLMPEGIEAQLDQQALADLIGYIKNWRYVGGESPALQKSR